MRTQHLPSTATPEQAIQVRATAVTADLGQGEYQPLRVGTNVVYVNHHDCLIARVSPTHETVDSINAWLHNVKALVADRAPVLSPLTEALELADGLIVTYWDLGQPNENISLQDMASLVSQWHQVPPPTSLELWTPGHQDNRRKRMIAAAREAQVPSALMDFLLTEMHEARHSLDALHEQLPQTHPIVPVHGDLYPGNIVSYKGKNLLIDCDFMCRGAPEADLAQLISHYDRTTDQDSRDFVAAYGLPVNTEFLRHATRLRELDHGLWLAAMWNVRPEAAGELKLRVANWHDFSVRWTTL